MLGQPLRLATANPAVLYTNLHYMPVWPPRAQGYRHAHKSEPLHRMIIKSEEITCPELIAAHWSATLKAPLAPAVSQQASNTSAALRKPHCVGIVFGRYTPNPKHKTAPPLNKNPPVWSTQVGLNPSLPG